MKDGPRPSGKKAVSRPGAKQSLRFKKIARLIADPNDSRSLKEKLESEGLTDVAFWGMLGDGKFLECVNKLIEKYTELERSQIWTALIKGAKEGDIRAIKLYFELKKESKEKHTSKENEEIVIKWQNGEINHDEKNFDRLLSDADAGEVPRLKKPFQTSKSGKKGGKDYGRNQ